MSRSVQGKRRCARLRPHRDLRVGSPVGGGHLVGEPGGDGLGGAGAVLGHGLDHVVHPVQNPLGGVLVRAQESIRLRK